MMLAQRSWEAILAMSASMPAPDDRDMHQASTLSLNGTSQRCSMTSTYVLEPIVIRWHSLHSMPTWPAGGRLVHALLHCSEHDAGQAHVVMPPQRSQSALSLNSLSLSLSLKKTVRCLHTSH